MGKIKKDQVLGIVILIVAAFFGYHTLKLAPTNLVGDPGPRMFPLAGCILMAVFAVVVIVHPEKNNGKVYLTKKQWMHAISLFGVYVLYLLLLWLLGFTIANYIALAVFSFMFSYVTNPDSTLAKRILKSVIYAAIVGTALYLLYVIALDAQLPRAMLWD